MTKVYCSFAKEKGTLGKVIHNHGFKKLDIDAVYIPFAVDNIFKALDSMQTLGIAGAAVSMPFKTEACCHVCMSEEAFEIGAVNTIINSGRALLGYNTDWIAAEKMLNRINPVGFIWIAGDGGYAKAVQYACKKNGIDYLTINRSNWQLINDTHLPVFNCTPVIINRKNVINASVKTPTGKLLAFWQAKEQFKLYTGLEYPSD